MPAAWSRTGNKPGTVPPRADGKVAATLAEKAESEPALIMRGIITAIG